MEKRAFILGGISFMLAVIIGAFGAHGLEELIIKNNRLNTFETGVKYHFYHSISILILGLVSQKHENLKLNLPILIFFVGIIVFSGSLYILSITNISWLGAITPIGGLCFILGWIMFLNQVRKIR